MHETRIKIEPIISPKVFNDFIKKHKFEFAGMSVSGNKKTYNQYLMCISDEPIIDIVKSSMESIDVDYILYFGEAYGNFCVAAEIKY